MAAAATALAALNHGADSVWLGRTVLGALVLAPLAVASHRLPRRAQLVLGALAAVVILGILWAAMPALGAMGRPAFAWPLGLSLLAAALVPFVAAGPHFTRFVRRFFEQTTVWALTGACAMAALFVVGLAIAELFDVRIWRVTDDAALALGGAIVLLYLDRLVSDDRDGRDGDDGGGRAAASGRIPELWRRLATSVGAPFVAAMLIILVAYEVSVLIGGGLPRNVLSPLIIAAGFIGFLSSLVLAAMAEEKVGTAALAPADPHIWARRPTARLARAFPLVLLGLLPLAGWALLVRIEQYGLTPFRVVRLYGLGCLGVLCLTGIARWLRGRSLTWEVPAAVLVFALAAAFGPTSAVALSLDSQSRLLARRLELAGVVPVVFPAASAAPRLVDAATFATLRDAIAELARIDGEPALRRVLGGDVAACAASWMADACLERLGVAQAPPPAPPSVVLEARGPTAGTRGSFVFVDLYPGAYADLELRADRVVVHRDGRAVGGASLAGRLAGGDDAVLASVLPLVADDGSSLGELAIQRLELARGVDALPEPRRLVGVWFRDAALPGP